MESKKILKTIEIKENDNGSYNINTDLKVIPVGVAEVIANQIAEQSVEKAIKTLGDESFKEHVSNVANRNEDLKEALDGAMKLIKGYRLVALLSILFNAYLIFFGGK